MWRDNTVSLIEVSAFKRLYADTIDHRHFHPTIEESIEAFEQRESESELATG